MKQQVLNQCMALLNEAGLSWRDLQSMESTSLYDSINSLVGKILKIDPRMLNENYGAIMFDEEISPDHSEDYRILGVDAGGDILCEWEDERETFPAIPFEFENDGNCSSIFSVENLESVQYALECILYQVTPKAGIAYESSDYCLKIVGRSPKSAKSYLPIEPIAEPGRIHIRYDESFHVPVMKVVRLLLRRDHLGWVWAEETDIAPDTSMPFRDGLMAYCLGIEVNAFDHVRSSIECDATYRTTDESKVYLITKIIYQWHEDSKE